MSAFEDLVSSMTWKVYDMISHMKLLMKLKEFALNDPVGMGDPFLENRDESWAPYLRFMYHCVGAYGMRLVVELGTYNGTCAAHMASANEYTNVVAIDNNPQELAHDAANYYPNIVLFVGDSCAFHDRIEEIGLPIDMLFLDTLHDGVTPRRELAAYEDLLAEGALVVVDDLLGPEHLQKAMQEFWDELPEPKLLMHDLHPRRIIPGVAYHDAPGFGVCVWT